MGITFDEKSCGIVLFRDTEKERLFLILHYPGGHFDFPKGHIEEGEDEIQTATRELEEETGIADANFLPGFREEVSYKYMRKGQLSNKQVIFFLGETKISDIRISHEHQGHIWLPYEEALKTLTFDNAQQLLKKAKSFLDD